MIYRCQMCGEDFEGGWTDEEAMAECKANFGDVRTIETVVVCDDCYKEIDPQNHPHIVEEAVAEMIRDRQP